MKNLIELKLTTISTLNFRYNLFSYECIFSTKLNPHITSKLIKIEYFPILLYRALFLKISIF